MLKLLLLAFFTTLGLASASGPLHARTYVSHSDYLQLTTEQKNEHIKMLMQLMVDLEAQYKKDLRAGSTSSEYFRRYSTLLFKLQSFFIADAHAAPGDWADIASKYQNYLRSSPRGTACIFGGWPSTMKNNLCSHPKNTGARAGYLGGGCKSNEVSCNPIIFGYKNDSSKSVFCASTDNLAENSALQCMKKALNENPETGADAPAIRLAKLRENLNKHPALANEIFKFAYATCICDTTPVAMDSSYQVRIRPHRTCYGLMNMMANSTQVGCNQEMLKDLNISIFEQLRSKIRMDFSPNSSSGQYDALYEQFRTDLRKDNPNDVKAMCPDDSLTTPALRVKTPPNDDHSGNDQPDDGKSGNDRTNDGKSGNDRPAGGKSGDDKLGSNKSDDDQPDEIVVTATKCTATCTAPTTPDGDPVCTSFKKGDATISPDAGSTPVFEKETRAGTERRVIKLKYTPPTRPAAEGDAEPVEPEESREIICDIPDFPAETPTPVVAKPAGKLTVTITSKKTRTQMVLTAVVKKPDGTVIPDSNVEWFEKVSADDEEEDDSVPVRPRPLPGEERTPETTPETEAETTKIRGDDRGTGPTVTVDRETEGFEVCAVAAKEGFESSEEGCEEIEPLSSKDATPGSGMPQQGGPQPGVGGFGRNLGIR